MPRVPVMDEISPAHVMDFHRQPQIAAEGTGTEVTETVKYLRGPLPRWSHFRDGATLKMCGWKA